jgi:hypothetical protein
MGISGGGQPNPPSQFLADIGKGRMFGSRAAVLERFEGTSWHELGRYPSAHEANAALDAAMGQGGAPGTLRVVDATPSTSSRLLRYAGAAVFALVAILVIWFFVAG